MLAVAGDLARLRDYWTWLARHSPHYRHSGLTDRLPAAGDTGDPAWLTAVPITEKADVVADTDAFLTRPYGQQQVAAEVRRLFTEDDRPDPAAALRREWAPTHFQRSGGTTGTSLTIGYTWYDLMGPFRRSARNLYGRTGIAPTDLVFNLCPAAPHLGIYATMLLPALIGQPNFNTFGGKVIPTEQQIELAATMQPAALVGICSYIGHWARTAAELVGSGRVAPLRALRTVVAMGEPISDAVRDALGAELRAAGAAEDVTIVQGMSSTEMRAAGFYECAPGGGMHVDVESFVVEVLRPEDRRPAQEGEPGVLVWSHVGWRGHALARYWTGDLVHGGLTLERCEHCGSTEPRLLGAVTRHNRDFVKVRGARVDILPLLDAVRALDGVVNVQVVINRDGTERLARDRMDVFVGSDDAAEGLAAAVATRVAAATEVRPDQVHVLTVAEVDQRLFARKLKAEQFRDLRDDAT